MMWQPLRMSLLCVLLLVVAACAAPHYPAERLAALQAKEASGVVTKQSRGSFVLRGDDGRETTFRTGQMTEYLPDTYRSQETDRVRVAFREVLERTGRIKLEVLQLEALAVAEQNRPLPNPIAGTLVAIGPGSIDYARQVAVRYAAGREPVAIYLPIDGLRVIEDGKPVEIFDWQKLIGREIVVEAERVPIRRGNALIYVARRLELLPAR